MNLLLLNPQQINSDCALITGRQLEHLISVQRAAVGDSICVGVINGMMGQGLISALDNQSATIQLSLDTQPPPPLPLTMILALPRPKMLRRSLLQTICRHGGKTGLPDQLQPSGKKLLADAISASRRHIEEAASFGVGAGAGHSVCQSCIMRKRFQALCRR